MQKKLRNKTLTQDEIIEIAEEIAEETIENTTKGIYKFTKLLEDEELSKIVKIELLTALADYEIVFESHNLIAILKKLSLGYDRDIVFFSAYALGIGNAEEAQFFLDELGKSEKTTLTNTAVRAIEKER